MLAMSIGVSAVVEEESCRVHVIFPGMFECLEVDLNTDQKFLLFNLNNDERK
jgi:hypothetical protein